MCRRSSTRRSRRHRRRTDAVGHADTAGRAPVGRCTARRGRIDGYAARVDTLSETELEALVAEATVDCDDEIDELSGLFTMVQDNLVMPFTTQVLGVEVTVDEVDLSCNNIVAICHRGQIGQAIGLLDLPLPEPLPEGWQWIAAYEYWACG